MDIRQAAAKWQKRWEEKGIHKPVEDPSRPKHYILEMYPYPSGSGLHMGHARNYVMGDVYARYKKMMGFNVLHPMGFDSFGLPAENAAIKAKSHPKIFTDAAIENFIRQQKALGITYDWDRVLAAHWPTYYKWDQWIFLKMYERGLVFKKVASVNWCPKCQTVLANEQVHQGRCWRHEDTTVEVKSLNQWFFRITDYAQELLDSIDTLDEWPEDVKTMQRNWIGRSEGTLLDFEIDSMPGRKITVFTTRPDTVYGITFLVYAPEHPDVMDLVKGTKHEEEVKAFVRKIVQEDKFQRTAEDKEKEGLFTGRHALHPLTKEKIPIYIANFVLYEYGTGAIQAVPAHDRRDFEFARKYKIPIKVVIEPQGHKLDPRKMEEAYTEDGLLVNSGQFTGLENRKAIPELNKYFEFHKIGKATVQYKLRDWLLSRQRFWGSPIPVVYCDTCKNRKQKALIIHGFEGSPTTNWIPWMQKELERQGFEVRAPHMPNAMHPTQEEWHKILEHTAADFGPDDIVIGHSLGGKAAMHLAEVLKFGSLYLVAPAVDVERDWEAARANWEGSDVDALQEFCTIKTDHKAIERNTSKRVVMLSEDDPDIPMGTLECFGREWQKVVYKDKGHFDSKEYAELLSEILKDRKEPGVVPVPEDELPVKLPEDIKFTEEGGNPLNHVESFLKAKCPRCGGEARRETDTMDTFVDSSWYFLRYTDAKNDEQIFSPEKANYWMPIDTYIGGREHATMHLIYFRFITKFLRDLGLVNVDEPARRLFNQGMLHKGGFVMSKSRGNVVTQEEIESRYGIDTARFFLMFIASPDKDMEWDDKAVEGTYRFLLKVQRLITEKEMADDLPNQMSKAHETIRTVTETIEQFRYNIGLISIMEMANYLSSQEKVSREAAEILLKLMAPFTPHMCEELWEHLGHKEFISLAKWPEYDEAKIDTSFAAAEQLVNTTISDIKAVKELLKMDKIDSIKLIVSPAWKYELYSKVKEQLESTRNPGDILKDIMATDLKRHGQDIARIVPSLVKDPSKIPVNMIGPEDELSALESIKEKLSKEFGAEMTVEKAEESQEQKARNASPGKPAILLK